MFGWFQPKHGALRIKRRLTGYEPQQAYNDGRGAMHWFPLTEEGYWLEPDAFSFGKITKHIAMSKDAAKRAVLRARAINQQHIAA